VRFITDHAEQD